MRQTIWKRLLAGLLMGAVGCGSLWLHEQTKTVLTIGVMAGSYWDAPIGDCYAVIDRAIERFEEEHPNVKVKYTSGILKRDYSEWLAERYLIGREPDVFLVLPEDFGMLCELNALEPLDVYLERDTAVDPEDFYSAALESGQTDGQQFALPYECVPTLMFVNKTLLEKEQIAVPDNDWSWDDLYNICTQVTKDTDGDGEADQFGCYGYTWRNALASNHAKLFSDDGRSCFLTAESAKQSIEFVQKLDKLYAGSEITSQTFDEGNVAFRPFLFSDYRTYQPYPWRIKRYSGFEWDCIQMPKGPSGGNSSELSTLMMGISSRSMHKQQAWELMKMMSCSEEIQSMLFTDSHGVSALRSVTESKTTQEVLRRDTPGDSQLGLEILDGAMEQAIAAPHFRTYNSMLLIADGIVQEAMADDNSLTLQLQRAQRELEQYLQD